MYAYCLFCLTQRCKVIAKLMEIRGAERAFSPQIIRKQRKQGENVKKQFDLLAPGGGYMFLGGFLGAIGDESVKKKNEMVFKAVAELCRMYY